MERFVGVDDFSAACNRTGMPMNADHALAPPQATDADRPSGRSLVAPVALLIGGVVTIAWTAFLGWGALRILIYLFGTE
ncbi:hypothetical protein [Methylobacterium iners]|nr:hypothetical protein [Methylobacterium iners]